MRSRHNPPSHTFRPKLNDPGRLRLDHLRREGQVGGWPSNVGGQGANNLDCQCKINPKDGRGLTPKLRHVKENVRACLHDFVRRDFISNEMCHSNRMGTRVLKVGRNKPVVYHRWIEGAGLEHFEFNCIHLGKSATKHVPRPSRPCSGTGGTPVAQNLRAATTSWRLMPQDK
jgi:hypothetical protein